MNSGYDSAAEYLKPQFDTRVKQLDAQVAQMKGNIDNNISKLVNAKKIINKYNPDDKFKYALKSNNIICKSFTIVKKLLYVFVFGCRYNLFKNYFN